MRSNVYLKKHRSKKGRAYYYLIVRQPGKKDRCIPLGNVRREFAENQKIELNQQLRAGTYLSNSILAPTVSEFVEKFFQDFANGARAKKTVRSYREMLKPFLARFGEYRLNQITRQQIEGYLTGREIANRTRNIVLSNLRLVFQKAVEWDYLQNSPTLGVRRFPEEKGGSRALTYKELVSLWDRLRPWQKSVIMVMVFSGMRPGEVSNLKFQDINWEENELIVVSDKNRKTKTRRSRKIKLSPDLRDELLFLRENLPIMRGAPRCKPFRARLAHQREFVFCHEDGRPVGSFRKSIGSAFKKAGILGASPHSLRKTFCSLLARRNIHVKAAQRLLGHSDPSLTLEVYTSVEDDQLQEAVNALPSMDEMKKEKFRLVEGGNK